MLQTHVAHIFGTDRAIVDHGFASGGAQIHRLQIPSPPRPFVHPDIAALNRSIHLAKMMGDVAGDRYLENYLHRRDLQAN